MSRFVTLHVQEPALAFGAGQTALHPKDGLFLYGPVEPRGAGEVRVGAIGSRLGLELLAQWMERVAGFIPAYNNRAHHAPFPGVEGAFNLRWPVAPSHQIMLPHGELEKRIRYDDPHRRVFDTVDLIASELKGFKRRSDVRPDIWFVVLPEDVFRYGRPQSRIPREERVTTPNRLGKKEADRLGEGPVLFRELDAARLPYQFEVNVHNQLKARLLEEEIITQIVRETTIAPDYFVRNGRPIRNIEDAATTAWNLLTAVSYKVAGPPWRLATVREHVCYVGLVYKVDPNRPADKRVCCGAQMFLQTGEGVVFRGHLGPWDSERKGEHHLDRETARALMQEVVESYKTELGRPPNELFIHGMTRFIDREWEGFTEGAAGVRDLTAVQIRPDKDIKLFRDPTDIMPGVHNVLRGTAIRASDTDAYLWTKGFVPRLQTYPGWEVPNPLKVSIHRGAADLETVLKDVLGLTKLNFNACIYGDGVPVTLRFAGAIGEILTAGPFPEKLKPLPFKHYI